MSVPPKDPNFPFVSVITPTYNRKRFIPSLIRCFLSQTYRKEYMEWIVYDDGDEPVEEIFNQYKDQLPNFRYLYDPEKRNIGAKRNLLNKAARGDIIVAMDDDDYYMPDRVAAAVAAFKRNPKVHLAGSSEVYMYYSDIQTIYKLGPYNANHATNGTMAWTKAYAVSHEYDETVTHAEEKSFLENYKNPMIQLDPMKVMLVMSHTENTFDKKKMREEKNNPFIKKTVMKLQDFIKDSSLRDFFRSA
uniref:Glycosyltransferase 2-like domain-containing protein n=1 Tax=viral metagenome TaxID=1070528 RepID=A0A6C0BJ14_9ZZZZ